MTNDQFLSDHQHPRVIQTARALVDGKESTVEQLECLFLYVRDQIRFEFPATFSLWDRVRASQIIEFGSGYCNTKATLMVALCRACDIPARVHFSLIDAKIMRGIFPGFSFPFLPESGPHSWTEIEIDGSWKPLDSYINDQALFRAARQRLEESGLTIGYSLACIDGKCSSEFNFGEKGFVHMGAVVTDLGVWEDASQFYESADYQSFNSLQQILYPVMAVLSNRNIRKLRGPATGSAEAGRPHRE